jgi:hypothetical protein
MTRLTIAIPNFNGGKKLKFMKKFTNLHKMPQDEFDAFIKDLGKASNSSWGILWRLVNFFINFNFLPPLKFGIAIVNLVIFHKIIQYFV